VIELGPGPQHPDHLRQGVAKMRRMRSHLATHGREIPLVNRELPGRVWCPDHLDGDLHEALPVIFELEALHPLSHLATANHRPDSAAQLDGGIWFAGQGDEAAFQLGIRHAGEPFECGLVAIDGLIPDAAQDRRDQDAGGVRPGPGDGDRRRAQPSLDRPKASRGLTHNPLRLSRVDTHCLQGRLSVGGSKRRQRKGLARADGPGPDGLDHRVVASACEWTQERGYEQHRLVGDGADPSPSRHVTNHGRPMEDGGIGVVGHDTGRDEGGALVGAIGLEEVVAGAFFDPAAHDFGGLSTAGRHQTRRGSGREPAGPLLPDRDQSLDLAQRAVDQLGQPDSGDQRVVQPGREAVCIPGLHRFPGVELPLVRQPVISSSPPLPRDEDEGRSQSLGLGDPHAVCEVVVGLRLDVTSDADLPERLSFRDELRRGRAVHLPVPTALINALACRDMKVGRVGREQDQLLDESGQLKLRRRDVVGPALDVFGGREKGEEWRQAGASGSGVSASDVSGEDQGVK
jgi:hypothetical protein